MSTWDVARANAAVLTYQAQKVNNENQEKTAKKDNQVNKTNGVDTTGVVAFDNGIYSTCQNGHFEAAA